MNKICDYDERYDRVSAYEIGWCYKCKCNSHCLYKKKAEKEMRARNEKQPLASKGGQYMATMLKCYGGVIDENN